MAKRKRDVPVLFWVSAEELELIHQKMQQYGTENLSAYLRKMALDGYVVKLELPELKELVSLMRRSRNNLNLCLALHGTDLHIRSGAWSAQHGNCSAWRGCAYYLLPAEWCNFAGQGTKLEICDPGLGVWVNDVNIIWNEL